MSATRSNTLQRFANETFDVLVIGGGIVGAGVARDAEKLEQVATWMQN